jgi:hypothetical protein
VLLFSQVRLFLQQPFFAGASFFDEVFAATLFFERTKYSHNCASEFISSEAAEAMAIL